MGYKLDLTEKDCITAEQVSLFQRVVCGGEGAIRPDEREIKCSCGEWHKVQKGKRYFLECKELDFRVEAASIKVLYKKWLKVNIEYVEEQINYIKELREAKNEEKEND